MNGSKFAPYPGCWFAKYLVRKAALFVAIFASGPVGMGIGESFGFMAANR